uniref:NADH-plastoquinone oxidoreductase subunit K n=1 Tax=Abies georgei var. smithii TaxID=2358304 RepID=A0A858YCS5_9CONI|nr:NADH-plastoquinone oxidoreductase subunit K [Abies georgei var. smithii]QJU48724.1 NADH-plastoquinone oxidoreductase subunit K [Abies georgei var. smithii]
MPEPKYVVTMGACSITEKCLVQIISYSTVRGVDKLIPADVHSPSCPLEPEAIIDVL